MWFTISRVWSRPFFGVNITLVVPQLSCVWKGHLASREALSTGGVCRIGNKKKVLVWFDKWVSGSTQNLLIEVFIGVEDLKVSSLIHASSHS